MSANPSCTCEWAARGIKGAHHSTDCPVVQNLLICPGCGLVVPDDVSIWVVGQKFYCSETCAQKAALR